jgi:hypothetical protein
MFILFFFSAFFLTTENEFVLIAVADLAGNSLERFVDFVDGNLRVNVTINNVDAHANNAASGVTTSGTSGNFDDFALRAKLASRGAALSVNLPLPFLRLAGVLGMVIDGESMSGFLCFWWVEYEMRDTLRVYQIFNCTSLTDSHIPACVINSDFSIEFQEQPACNK